MWNISQNFSFCIYEKISLNFDVKTGLIVQHGTGNMVKKEMSVQYQNHTLQKA